jgi:large subunit ribosomal protein L29
MKKHELYQLNPADLGKLLQDTQEEISKLRMQKALGQLDNIALIRNKRKDVARILTLMNGKKAATKS